MLHDSSRSRITLVVVTDTPIISEHSQHLAVLPIYLQFVTANLVLLL